MSGSVTIQLPPLTVPQREWLDLPRDTVFKRSEDFEKLEVERILPVKRQPFVQPPSPQSPSSSRLRNWPLFFRLSDILASWKQIWTDPATSRVDEFVSLAFRHLFPPPTLHQESELHYVILSTCRGSIKLFNKLYWTLYESRRWQLTRLPVEDLRDLDAEWTAFEKELMMELEGKAQEWKGARARMEKARVPGVAPAVPDAPDLTVVDFMAYSQRPWDQ
ncbi:hypothetical protein JCM5296_002495 [Sporobolomyces johnsonii]